MSLTVGQKRFKILFTTHLMHQIIVIDRAIIGRNQLVIRRVHHHQRLVNNACAVIRRQSGCGRRCRQTLDFLIQFKIIGKTRIQSVGIIERIAACLSN